LGVISAVGSLSTPAGTIVAVGSLDGKGLLWRTQNPAQQTYFAADPALTVESLRELRFAATGGLLAGWGRLGVHVWDTRDGTLLWSHSFIHRAVSAHYSLDMVPLETSEGQREVMLALPLLLDDNVGPRALGVRGTDVVSHIIGTDPASLSKPLRCIEAGLEKRQFWAIRLRALAQDAHTLLTLSCAHVPGEADEMAIVRRWNLTTRSRFGGKTQPQIALSIIIGRCADYNPPYVATPDVGTLGLVYTGQKIRLYDTMRGTYNELASGTMGGSAKVAISPGAQWLAVAREDSEINEGVIDLWSISKGQIEQKLYHPGQISALHFTEKELVVALTDGTVQVWN
jgi:WD40 repeat protein